MKRIITLLITTFMLFGLSGSLMGQAQLFLEDFTDTNGLTITAGAFGNDGSSDYFDITDGSSIGISYTGNTGNYFAAQDIDDSGWAGSASPSVFEIQSVDIAGYSNLEFSGLFASDPQSAHDDNDYVLVEYQIDSGGWNNLIAFENDGTQFNTTLGEDTDFDGNSDGVELTTTLTSFTKSITGTGSNLDLRVTVALNSGNENIAFDEFEISGTSAGGTASKLAVTTINNGDSPTVNAGFDVVVQAQTDEDNPITVDSDTDVTLSLGSGNGNLGGTVTGTISSGQSSVTISGVTYDLAESGVSITASDDASNLTSGTSSTFEVLAAADELVVVDFPSSGFVNVALQTFTVEARRSGDDSVDETYAEDITISKTSGTGAVSGTVTQTAVNGVATFSGISFDSEDTYTVGATDGSLTSMSSSGVEIYSVPENPNIFFSEYIEGSSSNKAVEIYNASDSPVLFRGGGSDYYIVLVLSNASSGDTWSDANVNQFADNSSVSSDDVYVIGNSSADAAISNESDESSSVTFFNGNDPLALVKDVNNNGTYDSETDIIIDVIGTIDGTMSLGEVTLVRKNDTQTGTDTFDASEWTFESQDTFSFLGSHNYGPFVQITGNAGWRMLSFPITGGTVEDISDNTAIQGVTGGDNTEFDSNFLTYDDAGSFETPADVSTAIGDGYGFLTYFFDNTAAGSSELPITLDAHGAEPSSDVSVTLNTSTQTGGSYFTMVGNPFGSNYDLSAITVNGGTIQNNVQFWDDAAGSYVAGDRTTPFVAGTWQGFWIESADGATDITFPTSGKTSDAATETHFSKEQSPGKFARVSFELSSEQTTDKALQLSFTEGATTGWDAADASKIIPMAEVYATFGFVGDDRLQSVFSLPYELTEDVDIAIAEAFVGTEGEFTLSWEGVEGLPEGTTVLFHDYQAGQAIDLSVAGSYTFTAGQTADQRENPLTVLLGATPEVQDSEGTSATRFGLTVKAKTSVSTEPGDTPQGFALEQNYPNPFNPTTVISYQVPVNSQVSLKVFDMVGREVATLVDTRKSAGQYKVDFDASALSSGIYLYRLQAGSQVLTRQMTLIK